MMKRRGLSLVELLVVIGIIAVLIAILMPALQKARKSAGSIRCADNLRQLSAAVLVYAQDFDGWLAFDDQSGDGAPGIMTFWQRLSAGSGLPYQVGVYSGTTWTCPMVDVDGIGPPDYFVYRWDAQYSINNNLRGVGDQPVDSSHQPVGSWVWTQKPHKLVEATANTMLLADGAIIDNQGASLLYFIPGFDASPPTNFQVRGVNTLAPWPVFGKPAIMTQTPMGMIPSYGVAALHNGAFNAAFGDGHVESLQSINNWTITPQ